MWTRRLRWLVLAGLIWPGPLPAATYHTPLDPSQPGGIIGRVAGAATLQSVVAIEPYELKAYEAAIDPNAGTFAFRGLPPGEYDLLIKTVGRAYEGLTLKLEQDWKDRQGELGKLKEGVAAAFLATEDYFNVKHIARLAGSDKRARVLAVQTRTRPVVEPSGKPLRAHIRRFDLLDMVKTRTVWQVAVSRHLLRQEVPYGSPDTEIRLIHAPRLGGILVGDRVKDLGVIDVKALAAAPDKAAASAGVSPSASPSASASGGITGSMVPIVGLERIVAVEPARLEVHPGQINRTTGAFEFRCLPPGRYDLLIQTVGRVYEGLRLKGRAGPEKLNQIRKEIAATSFGPEGAFSADQIVRLGGAGSRAQVLAVRAATAAKPDAGGGEASARARRIELFDLVKEGGSWRIEGRRLLAEQKVPPASAEGVPGLTYSPTLGGIAVSAAVRNLGEIDLRKLAGARPSGSPGPSLGRRKDD